MVTEFQWINFFLAFLEGLALIVSPCILPILPILLSSTITGGKRRPLGIIMGFSLTFAVFTLLSHFLVAHLKINLDIVRDAAFILIILFGIVMVSDYLTEKFNLFTQKLANLGNRQASPNPKQSGFFSGLLMGSLISLIWTPCAGPILAAALVQIAVQKTTAGAFLALLAFALGSVVPMLVIALLGKTFIHKIGFIKKRTGWLRKIFGVIIIVTAVILILISHFRPQLFASLAKPAAAPSPAETTIPDEPLAPYPAPPLAGLGPWINSAPLTIAQLHGKVVLIDFWTYSCINCIRTLPYLLIWDKKYHGQGLVIIGIHTPEFEFEKNPDNVRQAVMRFNIPYPVALDNQYKTWNNYNNRYWPAHYLIDKNGQVVSEQFGEGHYAETERNIRLLLGLSTEKTTAAPAELADHAQTPETYLGSARAENFASPEPLTSGQARKYTFPSQLSLDQWALQGDWTIKDESIFTNAQAAAIKIHFHAGQVYAVIGNTAGNPVKIRVLLNGKPIAGDSGADVQDGVLTVTTHRLYALARLPQPASGEMTLIIESPGVEFFTFTFG